MSALRQLRLSGPFRLFRLSRPSRLSGVFGYFGLFGESGRWVYWVVASLGHWVGGSKATLDIGHRT